MHRILHWMSQPIQNSPWTIIINLTLAPLIMLVLLLPYILLLEATSGQFAPLQSLFSALFIGFFVCLSYWIMVFPFLLIIHLLLRHYQQFNMTTILLSCVLGTLILTYISAHQFELLLSQFFFLSCFSLPMALFYIFLSWQAKQN